MDVYFLCEPSLSKNNHDVYKKEVSLMKSLGHIVTLDLSVEAILSRKVLGQAGRNKDHLRIAENRIKISDLVVVDASCPSIRLADQISFAIENKIPVLVVYSSDLQKKIFPLFLGGKSCALLIKRYTTESLDKTLIDGLKEMSRFIKNRFNIVLSGHLSGYLDWISKEKKLSRGTYLRGLLEEKMLKDKEYKNFVRTR